MARKSYTKKTTIYLKYCVDEEHWSYMGIVLLYSLLRINRGLHLLQNQMLMKTQIWIYEIVLMSCDTFTDLIHLFAVTMCLAVKLFKAKPTGGLNLFPHPNTSTLLFEFHLFGSHKSNKKLERYLNAY